MALIQTGALITLFSGSVGGQVLSHNKGGMYIKNKGFVSNPQTTYQLNVRANFGSTSSSWSGLTQAQIAAWNQAGHDTKYLNAVYSEHSLSGKALFERFNRNLFTIGLPPITDPPLLTGVPTLDSLTLTAAAGAGTLQIDFTPTPIPAGFTAVVRMTPGLTPGTSFYKNRFGIIKLLPAATTSPNSVAAAYIAKFGSIPIAGKKLAVEIYMIDIVSGQAGLPFRTDTIVAP